MYNMYFRSENNDKREENSNKIDYMENCIFSKFGADSYLILNTLNNEGLIFRTTKCTTTGYSFPFSLPS